MKQKSNKNPGEQTLAVPPKGSSFDVYTLILVLYAWVPVITPNLNTFDSNGPKFLAWAILNIVVYAFLVLNKDSNNTRERHRWFLSHPAGIAYILFLLIALASFFKASEVRESVVLFAEMFTVFSSALILFIIFSRDRKYFLQATIILSIILLFDSVMVLFNVFLYSLGELKSISEIKSVYSNKNILSSAIFVKLPFALWLMQYSAGKWKNLGMAAVFLGILATLLLSTRAFYLGLTGLSIAYLVFNLVQYLQRKDKTYPGMMLRYSVMLGSALLLMYLIQGVFYPKARDTFSVDVVKRIETINTSESSAKLRLETWKFSGKLIIKEPLLGVGLGNWKIAELEYESPIREDFEYMYRNHNDFIEVTAETGIPGGAMYLILILVPGILFLKTVFARSNLNDQSFLFISAFGIFCYGFDAFFNFPITRPEIQMLFAFFIAAGVCVNPFREKSPGASKSPSGRIFMWVTGLALLPVVFLLYSYFVSLRYQRIAHEEVEGGFFDHTSGQMIAGFPFVPSINAGGEPITVTKSRYLINDGKYEEAIRLLRSDWTSPFDGRFELFMMYAFDRLGNKDSTMYYAKKVNAMKPLYYQAIEKICLLQQESGDYLSPVRALTQVINRDKQNMPAREYRARCYFFLEDYRKCVEDLNVVLEADPLNSKLMNIRGICFNSLNDPPAACKDFAAAMKLGSKEAEDNYTKVCGGVK